MKSILILATVLSFIPTLAIADEVEKIHKILNANKKFDDLRKGASGNAKLAEDETHYEYMHACLKVNCPDASDYLSGDAYEKYLDDYYRGKVTKIPQIDEFRVGLAKIKLKSIEEANLTYAKALIEFHKQIMKDCKSEEINELFTSEQPSACTQEVKCEGTGAALLADKFEEHQQFEKNIERKHRELSKEEKVIAGIDISKALKKPIWKLSDDLYDQNYPLDYALPQFRLGSLVTMENHTNIYKKYNNSKKHLLDGGLPEGFMTIRALKCERSLDKKNGKLTSYDRSCTLVIGNENLTLNSSEDFDKPMGKNNCLKGATAALQKSVGKKSSSSSHVNDTERGEIKEVTPSSKPSEESSSKATKQ